MKIASLGAILLTLTACNPTLVRDVDLDQVDQNPQALALRSGPPLPIRGTSIYFTLQGMVRILMDIEVDRTTFANMFQTDDHSRTVAVNIGKHFIETVTNIYTEMVGSQYEDSFFALVDTAKVWVVFDAVQGGQYAGSIAIYMDCTGTNKVSNWLEGHFMRLVLSAEKYFSELTKIPVVAQKIDSMVAIGMDIIDIPVAGANFKRSLLEQQICAKPVDLRPGLRNEFPNWSMQKPMRAHC